MISSPLASLADGVLPTNNVTRLAEVCTEVVDKLMFRDADQSFAGIGVLTTFAIQGAYLLLFACVASLVCACIPEDASNNTKQFGLRLRSLFLPTYKTAFYLCMVTLITCLVRLMQGAPLFELALMRDLAEYESSAMLLGALAYLIHRFLGQNHKNEMKNMKTDLTVWLICTVQFITKWPVTFKIQKAIGKGEAIKALALQCAQLDQTSDVKIPAVKTPSMRTPLGGGWPIFLTALGFCFFVLAPLATIVLGKWPLNWAWVQRRAVRVIASTLLVATFTVGTGFEMIGLLDTRSTLVGRCGSTVSQWRFFQIAAVLIWLPLTARIILVLLSLLPFGQAYQAVLDFSLIMFYGSGDYSMRDSPRQKDEQADEESKTQSDKKVETQANSDEKAGEDTSLLKS